MTVPGLSVDGQAIALMCSTLALADGNAVKPLAAREWHELTVALRESPLERPRDLLGRDATELAAALGVSPALAERLARLLSRGGQLAVELERLASRGIWVLTRADPLYPTLLKQRLRGQAPPVLFGAGVQDHLGMAALAVVGSRDVDDDGLHYAQEIGRQCARQGLAVVSGAARGVDLAAMSGSLERGGVAIGITVDPLERLVRQRELRQQLADGRLTLATPFHPRARWHAGNAMRRNRLIYALSRAAVVVATSAERGGTRAGALENLGAGWVSLHVRDDGSAGTRQLIAQGARPLVPDARDLDVARLLVGAGRPSLLDEPLVGADADGAPSLTVARMTPPPAATSDPFQLVWPALAQYLSEPRSVEDVAEQFQLVRTQARAWLKRAADEQLVATTQRPRRYLVREAAEQERLFVPVRGSG